MYCGRIRICGGQTMENLLDTLRTQINILINYEIKFTHTKIHEIISLPKTISKLKKIVLREFK